MVLQNEEVEHLGFFSKILNMNNLLYQYVKLFEDEHIPNLKDYAAIIILGGPMNVYEDKKYPFLKKETSIIKEALKIKKPVLGLCLGAQIIAKAVGSKVYPAKRQEVGWFTIDLSKNGKDSKIFNNIEERITVFQWHNDTFDIPESGKKLATSNLGLNQAFSIGEVAYGLQFHLEVTKQMIFEWINRYDEDLKLLEEKVDTDEIIRYAEQYTSSLNKNASILLTNFLQLLG